jgi:uncharacterized protein YlxW (UPF0749 family)
MSLLVDLMNNALDGGYAEAAQRRHQNPQSDGGSRWLKAAPLTIVLVVTGLLLATSAVQVRHRAPSAAKVREQLIGQVREKTKALEDLQHRLDSLQTEVATQRDAALRATTAGEQHSHEMAMMEEATGGLAMRGPGVRVVLDNGKPAEPGAPVDDLSVIFDRDIQAVVNALWASGAEAIAVNGRRLTVQTAIRAAGDAILVDFRPLSPPYTIEAIGDPRTLEARFSDTSTARLYRTWRSVYGIRFTVSSHKHLEMPASSHISVRYARPLDVP